MKESAVLIAGPTASGKSSRALAEAETARAAGRAPIIVNADSMQVYRELRVISARPGPAEEAQVPHCLYGFVSASEAFSTGAWLSAVGDLITQLPARALPIFVGGTGLYFKALTEGFAEIPPIPASIRAAWRDAFAREGAAAMHEALAIRDPAAAAVIRPSDGQRILRALEVFDASGQSILHWQAAQKMAAMTPLLDPADCRKIVVLPERSVLYAAIDARFEAMVDNGALSEVADLATLALDPMLPAMKAIGVPQLLAHLAGVLSLEEAIDDAKRESRRYAKRQMTWLRNQMGADWLRLGPDDGPRQQTLDSTHPSS